MGTLNSNQWIAYLVIAYVISKSLCQDTGANKALTKHTFSSNILKEYITARARRYNINEAPRVETLPQTVVNAEKQNPTIINCSIAQQSNSTNTNRTLEQSNNKTTDPVVPRTNNTINQVVQNTTVSRETIQHVNITQNTTSKHNETLKNANTTQNETEKSVSRVQRSNNLSQEPFPYVNFRTNLSQHNQIFKADRKKLSTKKDVQKNRTETEDVHDKNELPSESGSTKITENKHPAQGKSEQNLKDAQSRQRRVFEPTGDVAVAKADDQVYIVDQKVLEKQSSVVLRENDLPPSPHFSSRLPEEKEFKVKNHSPHKANYSEKSQDTLTKPHHKISFDRISKSRLDVTEKLKMEKSIMKHKLKHHKAGKIDLKEGEYLQESKGKESHKQNKEGGKEKVQTKQRRNVNESQEIVIAGHNSTNHMKPFQIVQTEVKNNLKPTNTSLNVSDRERRQSNSPRKPCNDTKSRSASISGNLPKPENGSIDSRKSITTSITKTENATRNDSKSLPVSVLTPLGLKMGKSHKNKTNQVSRRRREQVKISTLASNKLDHKNKSIVNHKQPKISRDFVNVTSYASEVGTVDRKNISNESLNRTILSISNTGRHLHQNSSIHNVKHSNKNTITRNQIQSSRQRRQPTGKTYLMEVHKLSTSKKEIAKPGYTFSEKEVARPITQELVNKTKSDNLSVHQKTKNSTLKHNDVQCHNKTQPILTASIHGPQHHRNTTSNSGQLKENSKDKNPILRQKSEQIRNVTKSQIEVQHPKMNKTISNNTRKRRQQVQTNLNQIQNHPILSIHNEKSNMSSLPGKNPRSNITIELPVNKTVTPRKRRQPVKLPTNYTQVSNVTTQKRHFDKPVLSSLPGKNLQSNSTIELPLNKTLTPRKRRQSVKLPKISTQVSNVTIQKHHLDKPALSSLSGKTPQIPQSNSTIEQSLNKTLTLRKRRQSVKLSTNSTQVSNTTNQKHHFDQAAPPSLSGKNPQSNSTTELSLNKTLTLRKRRQSVKLPTNSTQVSNVTVQKHHFDKPALSSLPGKNPQSSSTINLPLNKTLTLRKRRQSVKLPTNSTQVSNVTIQKHNFDKPALSALPGKNPQSNSTIELPLNKTLRKRRQSVKLPINSTQVSNVTIQKHHFDKPALSSLPGKNPQPNSTIELPLTKTVTPRKRRQSVKLPTNSTQVSNVTFQKHHFDKPALSSLPEKNPQSKSTIELPLIETVTPRKRRQSVKLPITSTQISNVTLQKHHFDKPALTNYSVSTPQIKNFPVQSLASKNETQLLRQRRQQLPSPPISKNFVNQNKASLPTQRQNISNQLQNISNQKRRNVTELTKKSSSIHEVRRPQDAKNNKVQSNVNPKAYNNDLSSSSKKVQNSRKRRQQAGTQLNTNPSESKQEVSMTSNGNVIKSLEQKTNGTRIPTKAQVQHQNLSTSNQTQIVRKRRQHVQIKLNQDLSFVKSNSTHRLNTTKIVPVVTNKDPNKPVNSTESSKFSKNSTGQGEIQKKPTPKPVRTVLEWARYNPAVGNVKSKSPEVSAKPRKIRQQNNTQLAKANTSKPESPTELSQSNKTEGSQPQPEQANLAMQPNQTVVKLTPLTQSDKKVLNKPVNQTNPENKVETLLVNTTQLEDKVARNKTRSKRVPADDIPPYVLLKLNSTVVNGTIGSQLNIKQVNETKTSIEKLTVNTKVLDQPILAEAIKPENSTKVLIANGTLPEQNSASPKISVNKRSSSSG